MKTNFRSHLSLLLGGALLVGAVAVANVAPSESNAPITSVTASTDGRFSNGYSWTLHVAASGIASLDVRSWPPVSTNFAVTREQLQALSDLVDEERFFALKGEYGEGVVDGSTKRITIVRGAESNTVSYRFLMNWQDDPERLREPASALRIFSLVRSWFDVPQAVDLRRYDQVIVDIVDRHFANDPQTDR